MAVEEAVSQPTGDGQCVVCGHDFTPVNPFSGNLPIKIKYPGGEEDLPVDTLSGENKGPVCKACLGAVILAMKAANEATGISFVGKDAHLND